MRTMAALAPAFFVGTLFWASSAWADRAYDNCVARTSTNSGWAACGSSYLKRLDGALNSAWKIAISSVGDQQSRAQLLEEQRAWIKFRDASCQFFANGSFGREGQVIHYVECRAAIIEARISDLKNIAEVAR